MEPRPKTSDSFDASTPGVTGVTNPLSLGGGGTSGQINLLGSTSGTFSITANATATTINLAGSGGIATISDTSGLILQGSGSSSIGLQSTILLTQYGLNGSAAFWYHGGNLPSDIYSNGAGTNDLFGFKSNSATFYGNSGAIIGWSSSATNLNTAGGGIDTAFTRISAGTVGIGNGTAGNTTGNLQFNQLTKYNNESTAGIGTSYIRGVTSQKNETGADAALLSVTPPASAGLYRITVVLSVSAATAATLGWTATWTDSNGTAQAPTNLAIVAAGAAPSALTVTAAAGGVYFGEMVVDINNSATAIVVKTTFAGTSIAYKATATIERIN